MSEPQQSLSLVIPEKGLMTPDTVSSLELTFGPLYARADDLMRQAALVKVTALDQLGHMQTAKTVRLQLRGLRGEIAAAHKTAKEDSLKKGRAIDLIKNTAVDAIGKAEDYLTEQENFKARHEAALRDGTRNERLKLLSHFTDLIPLPQTDVADLSTEDFGTLLAGTEARHSKEMERLKQEAEAKRQQEQADKIERERLEAENQRLCAEQTTKNKLRSERTALLAKQEGLDMTSRFDLAEIDPAMFASLLDKAAERKKARIAQQSRDNLQKARDNAALKKQQEEADRLKRELEKANEDSRRTVLENQKLTDAQNQERVLRETAEAQRETEKQQAASAPDAEKIGQVAASLEAFRDTLPTMTSGAAAEVMRKFHAHLTQSIAWLLKQKSTLE